MRELNHNELMRLYKEGESADNALYAEQRSNLLLVAGQHYARKGSRFWNRVRDDARLTEEQKIRLTINHIYRITKIYENNTLSYAPGVSIGPKNEKELQDQKAAELNEAVWRDIKDRHNFSDKVRHITQDFFRIGEVFYVIQWNPFKGKFLGYEQLTNELGEVGFDEMGQPIEDKDKPIMSGDFEFKRVFGFNVFRAREAKSLDESWFLGYREMVDCDELRKMVGDDEEKLSFIEESRDQTYIVFDGNGQSYDRQAGQCLVLNYFIRPCMSYPLGYFFIATEKGVLFEGELPFGEFPIIHEGADEVPTSPRCYSPIKQLRPIQGEINRAISQSATHQVTMGDDKLAVQSGTKIANGGLQPGVRVLSYSGAPPTVIPGRTGDQYLPYIENMVNQFYVIANLQEELQEKQVQLDPYSMLFMSINQKKKYSVYADKIVRFLTKFCEKTLTLAKHYYEDDMLIPAIGRSEIVNIPEFKASLPLHYQIRLDPGTEDMETKLGKQLTFNQVLQYVGSNLDPKDIGKLIRTSPYANNELAMEDLTLDYDSATNMILALDRGEYLPPSPSDDKKYLLKRLTNRTRKGDFRYLPPQVQNLYAQMNQELTAMEAEELRKIEEAKLGFIPQSGMAVSCDIYVPDPNNSSKNIRARVPYDSLQWLLQRLNEQGMAQADIMNQQQAVMAQIAGQLTSQNTPSPQPQGIAGMGPQDPSQPMLNMM